MTSSTLKILCVSFPENEIDCAAHAERCPEIVELERLLHVESANGTKTVMVMTSWPMAFHTSRDKHYAVGMRTSVNRPIDSSSLNDDSRLVWGRHRFWPD